MVPDGELLVLGQNSIPAAIRGRLRLSPTGRDIVSVNGVVRRFDRSALENELGLDLQDPMWNTWRDRPVIIASSMSAQATGQQR